MEQEPKLEPFNIDHSPIKEAYLILNARTPLELSNLYSEEDQKLMRERRWDYANPDLITNKIKEMLEVADIVNMPPEEKMWRDEILWFWYHHAISCAIWTHSDKESAKRFALKSLEYQREKHPNKITKLLNLLVHDNIPEAENWAREIDEEPEKSTASDLIEEYKQKGFFPKSSQ